MKKFAFTCISIVALVTSAFCSGFEIKTSDIIDQPGVEVLGDFKGSWYVIGFETPGNLNKPPRYKIIKYAPGVRSAITSSLYPSFGEKTLYLKSAFVNNKISMFYGKCDKLEDIPALLETKEGHKNIAMIYRQDYDPNTLEPAGEPQVVFDQADEHFTASGIEVAESEDKSKSAVLVKPYYRQQKYKVIMNNNGSGPAYTKVFDFKLLKDFLSFNHMKVGNNGQVLISTKVRTDVLSMATAKDKKPVLYHFLSIDKSGAEPKELPLNGPVAAGRYSDDPMIAMLNDGQMLIAYDYFSSDKSPVVKGISVSKYDGDFNLTSKKDITPDAKFVSMAAEYSKKEDGFAYVEIQRILPLDGGNFMLIAEHHRVIENKDKKLPSTVERHYLLTYRFDGSLAMSDAQFIPKKQASSLVDYAFSAQAFHKGNDVYLLHNDDWESDDEAGMSLQCTRFPAAGGEPETKKVVLTSGNFYTCMQHIYPSNGRLLLTEEKLVDFENVPREVKLLEVTLK